MRLCEARSIFELQHLEIRCDDCPATLCPNLIRNRSTYCCEGWAMLDLPLLTPRFCYGNWVSIGFERLVLKTYTSDQWEVWEPNDKVFFTSCCTHTRAACKDLQSAAVYWRSTVFLVRRSKFLSISLSSPNNPHKVPCVSLFTVDAAIN